MLINPANLMFIAGVVIMVVAIVVIVLNTRDYSADIDEMHGEINRIDIEIDEHIQRIDKKLDALVISINTIITEQNRVEQILKDHDLEQRI